MIDGRCGKTGDIEEMEDEEMEDRRCLVDPHRDGYLTDAGIRSKNSIHAGAGRDLRCSVIVLTLLRDYFALDAHVGDDLTREDGWEAHCANSRNLVIEAIPRPPAMRKSLDFLLIILSKIDICKRAPLHRLVTAFHSSLIGPYRGHLCHRKSDRAPNLDKFYVKDQERQKYLTNID